MPYVIACGDEGVQLNQGTRLGVVGAGFRLEGFSEVVAIFKQLFGDELAIVTNEENAWIRQKLDLSNWEQTTASGQQHIEALADKEGLFYAGFLPFADPKELPKGIKGHMVRPHDIHLANKICFTLGGGEQTFNLGQFVISADWVHKAKPEFVKKYLKTQVEFYQKLVGKDYPLSFTVQTEGVLGEKIAQKNREVLESLGYTLQ